jgi:RNA polymerase sigma-70 factor, ECF subfamily
MDGHDEDDAVLVTRARDGDVAAFEELVRRHRDRAYRVALRICRRPAAAEDVAQDALVRAWRSLPAFRGDARFSTWLYRIVTNLALNEVTRRREGTGGEVPEHAASAADDPAARTVDAERLDVLLAALDVLTPDQRACLVLREVEQLSYEEVAEVLDVTVPAVKGRLFRARQELAAALAAYDEPGGGPPVGVTAGGEGPGGAT